MLELAAIYVWIGLIILVVSAGIKHDPFSWETRIFIITLWPVFLFIVIVFTQWRRDE